MKRAAMYPTSALNLSESVSWRTFTVNHGCLHQESIRVSLKGMEESHSAFRDFDHSESQQGTRVLLSLPVRVV